MRLLCGTKEDPRDNFGLDSQILDRYYDNGAFVTVFPASILLVPQDARFRVNVLSVSLDFSPLNINDECLVYYRDEDEEVNKNYTVEPGHYSKIDYLLMRLDDEAPRGLSFEKRLLDKKQRVRMKIGREMRVKFSQKLANILGFDPYQEYDKGTHDAERVCDIYAQFRPLYLCSRCLTDPCWTPVGELPLLRQINVPDPSTLEDNGRQTTIFFDNKRWINVPGRRLHAIDFYFLCADMKSPLQLLRNSGGCVIDIELERDQLCFV